MQTSDARKRAAEAAGEVVESTPDYIRRILREKDEAEQKLADAWIQGHDSGRQRVTLNYSDSLAYNPYGTSEAQR